MKNIFVFFFAAFGPLSFIAQVKDPGINLNGFNRCATTEKMMELRAINPLAFDKNREKQEKIIQDWISSHHLNKAQVIYTVPVVVQIFGSSANNAVTDNRVYEQIDVINKDYRRKNSDTTKTPSVWKSISADCEIEFCLATQDPLGNNTNGIVRKTGSNTPATSDLWNTSQYLNLLVYNIGNGTLGFTYLPSNSPNNGVHISYQYFGKTGASAPYNLGRTASHEIGHWFNLEHIWGDDGTACNGSDKVGDTPNQAGENYGCPGFPHTDACTGTAPGVMYMNYMDYSDDNCMNMFTEGQKARMVSAINQYRPGLLNNGKCGTPQPTEDAGIESISAPSGNICSNSFIPVVVLKNFGTLPLSSCVINYFFDSNAPSSFNWSGNLSPGATTTVTFSAMTSIGGIHSFTANTSSPNGNTDNNTSNDQATGSFSNSVTGLSMPFSEGFEGAFLPSGWILNNPDGSTTWEKYTVGFNSSSSAYMANFNYNASGQADELISPAIDLSIGSNPKLTFSVAYRLYTNPASSPNYSDTLEVLLSQDCGMTYTSIYKKFLTALTTVTPTYSTSEFFPSGAGSWRLETVPLANFSSSTNAIFKFRHVTDYENNLFLDNINITGGSPCNITLSSTTTTSSCGQNDGTATVSPAGGSLPFVFLWDNGQTTATATGLSAGNYSVSVTDSNGCTKTSVASVSNTNAPVVIAGGTDASSFGACDGTASANAIGGVAPYTFLWSNGGGNATISGLCAGTYYVTVTDSSGCSAASTVIVSQPVGIPNFNRNIIAALFPNPTNGKIFAHIELSHSEYLKVIIYNNLGEKVYSTEKENFSGGQIEMNLYGLPEGIYLVEIETPEQNLIRKISLMY